MRQTPMALRGAGKIQQMVAAEQDQKREPPPEGAIAGEGGGAEDIAGA